MSERAQPSSVSEVAALVRRAAERGWRVAPVGGNSQREVAGYLRPGWQPDLELDLSGLAEMEHRQADLVARVGTGARLVELERALALNQQRWPVAPSSANGGSAMTLGGSLSSDRRSPRTLRYGRARDWVIGTTLVRFDGAVVHSGGSVVKNVSGYDLSKLYIGAWGAFGILVEASLKLDPLPEATVAIRMETSRDGTAVEIARTLRTRIASLSAALLHQEHGGGSLLLLLEGATHLVESNAAQSRELARDLGLESREVEPRSALAAWGGNSPQSLSLRIEHSPASEQEVLEGARALPRPPDRIRCQLGCGIAVLQWAPASDPNRLLASTRDLARSLGGWVAVDSAPGNVALDAAPPWVDPVARRLCVNLKQALDPAGIFPPLPIAGEMP